jgi:hypothetical protein
MNCTTRGEGIATTFVIADFTDEEAEHLAAGETRMATSRRPRIT